MQVHCPNQLFCAVNTCHGVLCGNLKSFLVVFMHDQPTSTPQVHAAVIHTTTK